MGILFLQLPNMESLYMRAKDPDEIKDDFMFATLTMLRNCLKFAENNISICIINC